MATKKEYEANCAMSTILNTADNLKFWTKEKNYGEMPSLLKSMNRGVEAMHAMLCMPSEPQLVQGYTADNWQEIIDGGYLCEFSEFSEDWIIGQLGNFGDEKVIHQGSWFQDGAGSSWSFCRPAQIKGVMRPIFVEPVDKEAGCAFFDLQGHYLFRAIWRHRHGVGDFLIGRTTKYIEV